MPLAVERWAMNDVESWLRLYREYDAELRQLARVMRSQYHAMQAGGFPAAFGDVEGELLYMLVREFRPDLAIEISPGAGWSTNYLLAGLTANGCGILHTFELAREISGRPTELVIPLNQSDRWDQQRLVVHVGDARQTVPSVDGTVGLLLLDSCHEDWFADWYVHTVLPRVAGAVMIHDIAFVDRLEASTEAEYVWRWLREQRISAGMVGVIEGRLESARLRRGYAERRFMRSNAVVFRWPQGTPDAAEHLPEVPLPAVEHPVGGDRETYWNQHVADTLRTPEVANRHRVLFEAGLAYAGLGEKGESTRCFQRAIGVALQGDPADRAKSLSELSGMFSRHRQWRFYMQIAALWASDPSLWRFARLKFRGW